MTASESPSQVPTRTRPQPLPLPLRRCPDAPPHVSAAAVHEPPRVAQFGAVATRADVRAQLRARYGRTLLQLPEVTLRVDTELELLRLGRAYEAITADAEWRRMEPAHLAEADDGTGPTPAERAAALAAA